MRIVTRILILPPILNVKFKKLLTKFFNSEKHGKFTWNCTPSIEMRSLGKKNRRQNAFRRRNLFVITYNYEMNSSKKCISSTTFCQKERTFIGLCRTRCLQMNEVKIHCGEENFIPSGDTIIDHTFHTKCKVI